MIARTTAKSCSSQRPPRIHAHTPTHTHTPRTHHARTPRAPLRLLSVVPPPPLPLRASTAARAHPRTHPHTPLAPPTRRQHTVGSASRNSLSSGRKNAHNPTAIPGPQPHSQLRAHHPASSFAPRLQSTHGTYSHTRRRFLLGSLFAGIPRSTQHPAQHPASRPTPSIPPNT